MPKEKGGAKIIALAVASTLVLGGGALAFFLVHPAGRAAFRAFLYKVSGKPLPPGETPKGAEEEPPGPKPEASPPPRELAPEVLAALARAREAYEAKDLDAAEAAARKALALDPACAEAKELLEKILEARAQAEKLRRKIAHDEALKAAKEFLAEGDLDRAEDRVGKALAEIPGSEEAKALRDKIAAERERIEAEAAAKRDRANELAREGNVALVAGEFDTAEELALKALEIDPGNVAAENLRAQVELARERAKEVAAKPPAGPIEIEPPAGPIEIEPPAGPIEIEGTGDGKVITLEGPEADPIEIPAGPDGTRTGPIEIKGTAEGPEIPEPAGPIEIAAAPKPEPPAPPAAPKVAPAGPVSIDVPRAPAAPVSLELPTAPAPDAAPPAKRAVIAVLAELDRAIQAEDTAAIGRLLSERTGGGILTGTSATRAEEIDNVRAFFEVASDIRVERTTRPGDVRADALGAEARSSFRISYRITHPSGVDKITRGYRALYRMARERGAWRIAGVVIEEERP